jgi:site-specific DNA-adenine methylase
MPNPKSPMKQEIYYDKTKALFPYFGGKGKAAPIIWKYFGNNIKNYVEPFAGSLATFFSKPYPTTSTLNDYSGLVINLWRSIQRNHESVAYEASLLNGEADLHACELQCKNEEEELKRKLEATPEYNNPKLAGRYLYGLCNKIGPFAVGGGPWYNIDGRLTHKKEITEIIEGKGISRQLPHLGDAGKGISRQLPHLGDAGAGISRKLPHLSAGRGISRKLPHLGNAGRGISRGTQMCRYDYILSLMQTFVSKLEHARLTCGDWKRVACSKAVTTAHGMTAVYLDPPYEIGDDYYSEGKGIIQEVVNWCKETENNPKLQVILSTYESQWINELLTGWTKIEWKQSGGYGGAKNSNLERIFISPNCTPKLQNLTELFDEQ